MYKNLFAAILCISMLFSCKKQDVQHTTVKGTFVSQMFNKPLADVEVYLAKREFRGLFCGIHCSVDVDDTTTNQLGEFELSHSIKTKERYLLRTGNYEWFLVDGEIIQGCENKVRIAIPGNWSSVSAKHKQAQEKLSLIAYKIFQRDTIIDENTVFDSREYKVRGEEYLYVTTQSLTSENDTVVIIDSVFCEVFKEQQIFVEF